MKLFNNLKVGTKILSGFFIVAIIAAIIGITGIINLNTISNKDTEMYEKMTVPMSNLYNMDQAFQKIRVNVRDIIISPNEKNILDIQTQIKANETSYNTNSGKFKTTLLTDSGIASAKTTDDSIVAYEKVADEVISLVEQKKNAEAIALISGQGINANNLVVANMQKLSQIKISLAKASSDSNVTTASNSRNIMIIFIIFGAALAMVLGLMIAKSITKPIKKLVGYADRIALGDADIEINNDSKDEIGILMIAFNKMVVNIKEQVDAVEKIGLGDLTVTFHAKSEKDVLGKNIIGMSETIKKLLDETTSLIKATQEGKLETRGNSALFNGSWGELVTGINEMIDAFVKPINVTSDYIDKISRGNIPLKITDIYKGDFNTIKNNLNLCIDSINLLVLDSGNLVEAALEGKLSIRADASKHNGDYKKIVEGVNNTLDAVIEPVKEASAVLQEMANGNLKVHVKGDYKGDHADIKNALNDTIDALSSYVTEISEVLDEMSNSNLQLSINNEYKGDFAQIKNALNLIIKSFNEVFSEINNAADQVSAGSNQVSDGSQALSQGTTEQASSVEELTSSITEVAAQTKQNAVNAGEANELALSAKDGAVIGNSHMKDMLKSMEDINQSSSNISKIIKVIDDIAFQTNMLALNAAVEAARAGQHGKGFAVVAEEVRNLAARSTNAAKETTDLIEGSIKSVEMGTKIANDTAESLNEIVTGVTKAATLVGEIASASNEQATAIYQINKGIEQVSDVVQTNSATAEQSAAASQELSSQASMLKNMVGKFRLKSSTSGYYDGTSLPLDRKVNMGKNRILTDDEVKIIKDKPRISLSSKGFGKY